MSRVSFPSLIVTQGGGIHLHRVFLLFADKLCQTPQGLVEYVGDVSVAADGRTCVAWAEPGSEESTTAYRDEDFPGTVTKRYVLTESCMETKKKKKKKKEKKKRFCLWAAPR